MLYLPSEDWNDRADLWNFLCTDNFNNWRAWSQWNLRILDTVTLTPEVELAERVLRQTAVGGETVLAEFGGTAATPLVRIS